MDIVYMNQLKRKWAERCKVEIEFEEASKSVEEKETEIAEAAAGSMLNNLEEELAMRKQICKEKLEALSLKDDGVLRHLKDISRLEPIKIQTMADVQQLVAIRQRITCLEGFPTEIILSNQFNYNERRGAVLLLSGLDFTVQQEDSPPPRPKRHRPDHWWYNKDDD